MTELMLADGPARYLGGSIETFALPYGAFIIIAGVLYIIFKRPHSVPRMKYLSQAHQTATGTREPGTAGMIRVRAPIPAHAVVAEAQTAVPGLQPPHASEALQAPDKLPETGTEPEAAPPVTEPAPPETKAQAAPPVTDPAPPETKAQAAPPVTDPAPPETRPAPPETRPAPPADEAEGDV